MITSLQDFDDSTAFERVALARALPLQPTTWVRGGPTIGYSPGGGASFGRTRFEDPCAERVRHAFDAVRPLLFVLRGRCWTF